MFTPISAPLRHLHVRAVLAGAAVTLVGLLMLAAGLPATAAPQARARTASTGSLVYLKSDGNGVNIWIARADGTGPRRVTSAGGWSLPSESNDGTIVGLTPGRTAPDGTQGYDLAVMDQLGHVTNRVPTPSDFSSFSIPAYPPDQARISPDGTKIAYDNWLDGVQTTYWTRSSATTLDWPNQTKGQDDNNQPAWVDDSHLMLMHPSSALNCDPDFPVMLGQTYHVGDGDNTSANWFDEPTNWMCGGWATGFTESISLAHRKLAIIEDDRFRFDDLIPRTVKLRLFTLDAQNPTSAAPTLACEIPLTASKFTDPGAHPEQSSPTFSSDGNRLAWGDEDGIHLTDLSNLSSCPSVTTSLLIPDGAEPYFSPATLPDVDLTPPETSIDSGPSGTVAATSASFTFSANEAGSTFACSLDGGGFTACSSPKAYASLAQGSHTFAVRATDPASNTDPTPATRTWTVDTVAPPAPTVDTHPANPTNATTASFGFSDAESGVAFSCSLDGGGFTACSSPKGYSGLAQGSHTFAVKATDGVGHASSATSFTWRVDLIPPETSIDSGPSGTVAATSASFTFSANEAGSTFACSLDGGGFTTCSSPRAFSGLSSGTHTFQVRATDQAGNQDASPASRSWKVALYRPDAMLRAPGSTAYVGDGVYNSTGANQTRTARATRGSRKVFRIKIQNDGTVAAVFSVKGPGGGGGFAVRYLKGATGTTVITTQVVAGTYATPKLARGSAQVIRLEVIVRKGATIGTVKAWLVTATSKTDPRKVDAVRAQVKVVAGG